ncbi:MAG: arginine--tRNA ligase [Minisyncoccia bacterium]
MREELSKNIKEVLIELGVKDPKFTLDYPTYIELGDYTTNAAMSSAKELSQKPIDLACQIKQKLDEREIFGISKIEIIPPGFINFFISAEYFAGIIEKRTYGKMLSGQKIIFEHSQPNPFKAFHIGHLMSNNIGEAVSRIIKANGAEAKVVSYNGDVGMHIAKAVWAMKNGQSLEDAYAYGNNAYETNDQSKQEIVEINKKIYDESDPEISKIYEKGREESFSKFEELYKRLGSKFDYQFYESQSGPVGQQLVEENMGIIFEKGEGGAIIFRGENYVPKTHTRVFLNSDGLPVYEAKELGLAQLKKDYYTYDKSITVTANEQDSFFRVVEVAVGEVFPDLKGKHFHLSHGILKLPSGKMSSRTGTIISAEDLIKQVKEKVEDKIRDRELNHKEIGEISEDVALGAIRFSILKQSLGGDIVFDFDKSISFDGDSGPYLQYATVRARSVLEKSKSQISNIKYQIPEGWQTTNLEKILGRFSSVVERAGREYAPHHLVTYLIDLAGEFNSFYASHKIIDETDPTSSYRLYITKVFVGVMEEGLDLLGIKIPQKM